MNYSDEDLKKMTEWSEKNKNDEPIHPVEKSKPLLHNGGLQNMAQLLSAGHTVAAYVMSTKTRDGIDEYIATYPDWPKPFRSAPIEIDESVESIHVRLAPPAVSEEDGDGVLKEMSRIAEHLGADPAKPITGAKQ